MRTKKALNGHASPIDFDIKLTPEVHRDGEWYVAFCPEVPEANGQGRTPEESIKSLKDGVLSIMQDRRKDAHTRAKRPVRVPDPA
jgi:predicted RNase H-like HicB family nuclease